MSPKTTPSAPAASRSAPPWWLSCCARGLPSRGCGVGSSADSARVPRRGATSAILPSYPPTVVRRKPAVRRSGGRAGRPGRALLAGLEQAVAQLGLLLRRRVPLPGVRQVLERLEPEQLQEERRRAVEHRAELRAPRLLDQ